MECSAAGEGAQTVVGLVSSHRQRAAEYRRRYRAENLERHRQYGRRKEGMRRARRRSSQAVPFTNAQLAARMAYWGNRCWICAGPFEAIDHVKPLVRGGPHMLANLQPACRACNSRKHTRWPFDPTDPGWEVRPWTKTRKRSSSSSSVTTEGA